ncbi:murein DD-endopeptidase MepM/ murein hydrolase activator NlpD [Hamadaea flava]|uniref:Peptidoglycan DD-metalloendopeptidase family protein n=1 Tax=Hamadaea flava TaxID=1742688 RepID=A0ABV8LZQ6_9ACTN|nr:M23 family metallopeptidase [Hamadaea flava]MCP2326734.1 murein DD-endopeptidase MepM/ murein hydrolase activator NlpD [Hamadaea flava]
MRRRKRFQRSVILLVAMAVALQIGVPSAYARPDDPRGDYNRIQAELKRTGAALEGATQRAADAVARYQAAVAALPAAEDRIAVAKGSVTAATVQSATAERKAAEAAQTHQAAEAGVQTKTQAVTAARERLSAFAVAAYTGSAVAEFNMLLEVRSPEEMIQRVGYLQRIAEHEQAAIGQARAARLAARAAANEAELARRAAADAEQLAHDRLVGARAAEQEAADAQTDLVKLVAERKSASDVADSERATVLRQYREQQEESDRISDRLRAWEAAQRNRGPVLRPGARLLTPVRNAWKSSDFGNRYDPYYHVWQLHAGVDLAADGGTPIYAAADGVVSYAGWAGGYGNYTCVRHGQARGKTMSTCYGHQSRILVSDGQRVRQGQLIGRVGTTGASTGNHLHFEVRLDGRPVNPLPYLPGCLC